MLFMKVWLFLVIMISGYLTNAQELKILGTSADRIFELDSNVNNFRTIRQFEYNEPINPRKTVLTQHNNGKFYALSANKYAPSRGLLEYDYQENKVSSIYLPNLVFARGSVLEDGKGNVVYTDDLNIYKYDPLLDSVIFAKPATGNSSPWSLSKTSDSTFVFLSYSVTNSFINPGVFEYNAYSDSIKTIHTFLNHNLSNSNTLYEAPNGLLYGTANSRSSNGPNSMIYSINPQTKVFSKVFELPTNIIPYTSGFVSNGNSFYGISRSGGAFGMGYLYECDTVVDTVFVKYNFSQQEGAFPEGCQLISLNDDTLVGTTYNWITGSTGTIFQYSISNDSLESLHTFSYSDGDQPENTLTRIGEHSVLGLTRSGGASLDGVIFEYDLQSKTYTKKLNLGNYENGSSPIGDLVEFKDSLLLGVCSFGGEYNEGVLYTLDLQSDSFKVLKDLQSGSEIEFLTTSGNEYYGVSRIGGKNDYGALYEYVQESNKVEKVVDFYDVNMERASSSLLLGADGNLYGTTSGGPYGSNKPSPTLYRFNVKQQHIENLFTFDSIHNYWQSTFNILKLGNDGNIYGTRLTAGEFNRGYIYKYNIQKDKLTVIHNFSDSINGNSPMLGLVKGESNLFYGITQYGGANNLGVLYEVNVATDSYKKLYDLNFQLTLDNASELTYHNKSILILTNKFFSGEDVSILKYDIQQDTAILTTYFNNRFGTSVNKLHKVYYCDSAINSLVVPQILADTLYFCSKEGLQLKVRNAKSLTPSAQWYLRKDSVNGELLNFNSIGEFYIQPTKSSNYFIREEGRCVRNDYSDSVFVIFDTTLIATVYDTVEICQNEPFVFPDGFVLDSVFTDLNYTSTITSNLGCDSVIQTSVKVISADTIKSQVTLCYGDSLKLSDGITIHSIYQSNKFYTNFTSQISGCDSINEIDVSLESFNTNVYYINGNVISGENGLNTTYQWINCNNGKLLKDSVERVFMPSDTGYYAVILQKNGCSDTSDCFPVLTIGLSENPFQNQITFHPNPTTGLININLAKQENVLVQVRNIQGQLIQVQQFNNESNLELNIEGKAGIYFIQLTNEKGERANMKVVKQ
jgi:uncharacterized repeat protein (TIGR03803 family)